MPSSAFDSRSTASTASASSASDPHASASRSASAAVPGADAGDGRAARLGRREELGAAVGRVRPVLGEAAFHQQVGDALHALPGDAHLPRDAGDGQRLGQHRAEHLPPGGGEPGGAGQFLGDREEPAVEPEDADRGAAEQVLPLPAAHAAPAFSSTA